MRAQTSERPLAMAPASDDPEPCQAARPGVRRCDSSESLALDL